MIMGFSLLNMSVTQWYFSFTGESGVVYRGYFNTGNGKELVAIKTCKRMFYVTLASGQHAEIIPQGQAF